MWGDERRFCFDKFYGHLQITDILRNNLYLNLFVQILSLDLSKPHLLEATITSLALFDSKKLRENFLWILFFVQFMGSHGINKKVICTLK